MCALPCLQLDPNVFRKERLYTEEVDTLLRENEAVLQAIYKHYRGLATSTDMK